MVKLLSEKRVPNVMELVRVLREVDSDGLASKIAKSSILGALGAGEIGDRFPITFQNTKAWCELVFRYLRSRNELGHNHPYTKTVGDVVWSSTLDLITRSFRKDNSNMLFDKLSREWKK